MPQETNKVKGYKVTLPNGKSKHGNQHFEVGQKYHRPGTISLCKNGFHFSKNAAHCFNYYDFDKNNLVFEIEATGTIVDGEDKSCCSDIEMIRIIPWEEVLLLANQGTNNTGVGNTGDRNTGNWNTGDWNTGNRNTGNWNTGNWNTGNWNTGNWNTGNWNTGDCNTGDRNTGVFCTGVTTIKLFNQDSEWTIEDFQNSKAFSLLQQVDTKMWVQESVMTDEEKEKYPSYKTADGYLKDIPFKEAFTNKWHLWNQENRNAFISLPNFNAEIFERITGVKID